MCLQHEQLGAEDTTSVAITEIDKPELVEQNLRGVKRKNLKLPVSKTLKMWVKEHADEIDECKFRCCTSILCLLTAHHKRKACIYCIYFSNDYSWTSLRR